MEQILIVEDDRDLNRGLCTALREEGRRLTACLNVREAMDQLLVAAPSLVLLDSNLPDGSGLSVLRACKERYPQTPVILLTANDTDMDIVDGLERGADDYITKPFSLSVLRARVHTQLRRAAVQGEKPFAQGRYLFDFKTMRFEVDGEAVELSKTEQKLLRLLTDHAGNTVTREILIDRVWTDGAELAHYLSASAMSARNVEREKEKIKTLIADISHQTKTPIANLLLYSELLAEEELTQTAREKLAALHGQTEKLQFLIEALVKLSRLENGIIRLRPEDHAVSYLFERVREQYEAKAQQKGLSLTVQETELHAVFDPEWTAEALANLADNAVKYTKSGEIALSAVAYEMFVRIDVRDTGMGIAEEEQGKIFSRFYRSQSAGESSDGVGIGLYLTREIVSGEGGYLRVQSAVGKGSLFSMYLPRE